VSSSSQKLPGAELTAAGFADLTAGRVTVASLLVSRFATRLADAGDPLPAAPLSDAERRLYALLDAEQGAGAHSAYNALTRRLVSYVRARERALSHSEQDLADVSQMLDRGLVDRPGLAAAFAQMRPGLFRFPAVNEPTFARRVAEHTQES
jgi:hypothetical protein